LTFVADRKDTARALLERHAGDLRKLRMRRSATPKRRKDYRRPVAALVRVELDDDYDAVRQAA
jgi:hypothetical protein